MPWRVVKRSARFRTLGGPLRSSCAGIKGDRRFREWGRGVGDICVSTISITFLKCYTPKIVDMLFCVMNGYMGARRNFYTRGGGKTAWTDKNNQFFSIFKRAKGTNENFRVFCTETAYDVILFKSERGNCPKLPSSGRL